MQADDTTLISFQYGVLFDGAVTQMPSDDCKIAKAAAESMAKSINRGLPFHKIRAVVVSRKVETKVNRWVAM